MTTPAIHSTAVYPNFGAVGGSAQLTAIIGALLTVVLILAVVTLVTSAVAWAVANAHGNIHTATRARTGVLIALGAAALAGAGVAWVNFLLHVGSGI